MEKVYNYYSDAKSEVWKYKIDCPHHCPQVQMGLRYWEEGIPISVFIEKRKKELFGLLCGKCAYNGGECWAPWERE